METTGHSNSARSVQANGLRLLACVYPEGRGERGRREVMLLDRLSRRGLQMRGFWDRLSTCLFKGVTLPPILNTSSHGSMCVPFFLLVCKTQEGLGLVCAR